MTTGHAAEPTNRMWLTGKRLVLYDAVVKRVSELQRKATDDETRHPDVAGRLALLRRSIKVPPGSVPAVWDDTIGSLPPELWGSDAAPSSWERAATAAITLFALHVQGSSTAVHRQGISMGSAVRRLANLRSAGGDADPAVFKRFQALATASTDEAVVYHLRSLITLMRSERTLQLDYGQLAIDIRDLSGGRSADGVRLRWGRDYHAFREDDSDESDKSTESDQS